jgi:tetratricopeptide (TPR) repeat protein
MWIFLGIILIVAGLSLVYGVLVKKFPQLKLIDLSSLAKERHAAVKSRIMKTRFDRSLGAFQEKTSGVASRAASRIRGTFDRAYHSLKRSEASLAAGKNRKGRRDGHQERPEVAVERVLTGLEAAEQASKDKRYEQAERLYIGVLKDDPKNIEAYRGLADLYIDQRLYDQASETLDFLLRLTGEDDRALGRLGQVEASRGNFAQAEARYLRALEIEASSTAYRAELGRVYQAMGQYRKAQEQYRLALIDEPRNPKYLDYFLEASILVGDTESARGALGALEEVNPQNAKLADFRARIEAMLEKA